MIVAEGQLNMFDILSKAYIHNQFPGNWIVSGIRFLPLKGTDAVLYEKFVNIVCSCLFPLAFSLLMPNFMSTIVSEKNEGLIEMMKINGLKMRYYWFAYTLFFLVIYLVMAIFFLLFGFFWSDLQVFQKTNKSFMSLTILVWGFNQIATTIFLQVFVWKSRNATSFMET